MSKDIDVAAERILFEENQSSIWFGDCFERNSLGTYVLSQMEDRFVGWLAAKASLLR